MWQTLVGARLDVTDLMVRAGLDLRDPIVRARLDVTKACQMWVGF